MVPPCWMYDDDDADIHDNGDDDNDDDDDNDGDDNDEALNEVTAYRTVAPT